MDYIKTIDGLIPKETTLLDDLVSACPVCKGSGREYKYHRGEKWNIECRTCAKENKDIEILDYRKYFNPYDFIREHLEVRPINDKHEIDRNFNYVHQTWCFTLIDRMVDAITKAKGE